MTVKACLGGHDAGASGVDEGAGNASIPISKRTWMASPEFVTFSGFCGKQNDFGREKNDKSIHLACIDVFLMFIDISSYLSAAENSFESDSVVYVF